MNEAHEAIYRRLAEHLDTLPDGYPPSTSGAELRVLERLFTPEEAELAVHLTLDRETARTIGARAGLSVEEAAPRLDGMARKGLILSVEREGGPTLYQAVPFVVGIFEFQVNDLTPELLSDLVEYAESRGDAFPRVKSIPQLRTVPIGVSLESHIEALPYERVGELVRAHDRFAVANCLCRTIARMAGTACDAPLETCLFFGDWADYYVNTGRGRRIEREEVFRLLEQANEANLVLQSSNSKEACVICCCCGCCCGVLTPLKALENPADEVASAYRAEYDESACVGCHRCLSRCQMDAISRDGDRISLASNRCIGCGLCVATCPSGALRLVRREGADDAPPPDDVNAMWRIMRNALADESHN
jgi:electron transport complex protein RnfB